MKKMCNVMDQRRAGVLLHPTSLPCGEEHWQQVKSKKFGTLGKEAYHFIDWLSEAGISVWQMLPTGPTLDDMSPYQSLSAHAGNPELISIDWLIEKKWISSEKFSENYSSTAELREQCAISFYEHIAQEQGADLKQQLETFCKDQAYWLDDFIHYCAFRDHFAGKPWNQWPDALRQHDAKAIKQFSQKLSEKINRYQLNNLHFLRSGNHYVIMQKKNPSFFLVIFPFLSATTVLMFGVINRNFY